MTPTDLTTVLTTYDDLIAKPAPETYETINLVIDLIRVWENHLSDDECLDYLANLLDHWSKG